MKNNDGSLAHRRRINLIVAVAIIIFFAFITNIGLNHYISGTNANARSNSNYEQTVPVISCDPTPSVNCSGADLSSANLQDANFVGANLSRANLSHANLEYADLENASLVNTNLQEADLQNADLLGANLAGATTGGAILCNTVMPDGSVTNLDCG